MKFGSALVALLSVTSVSAFAPCSMQSRTTASTRVSAAVATSFEEDLALTLKVIMDHEARSTTATKEQMLSQMKQAEKVEKEQATSPQPIDVSIPYNAAAVLAFEAAGSKGDFAAFEAKYIEETVAMVTAKKAERDAATAPAPPKAAAPKKEEAAPAVVDLSIPYDAAAKLAYEASNKKMSYDDFKADFEAKAVADVIAKRNDISIPYDAAAALAFMQSNRKMPYAAFKEQYQADARSAVMAKGNLSVNYDSAALLEYMASDRSMSFDDFKAKYEQDTIAMVVAKKQARDEA